MIKITIYRNNSAPEQLHFSQSSIKIGKNPQSDLPLDAPNIHPLHIEIIESKGSVFIYNQANDPFAALDNFPFRKKKLNNKMTLTVGPFRLDIEEEPAVQSKTEPLEIKKTAELEPCEKQQQIDVAALVQEVEALNPIVIQEDRCSAEEGTDEEPVMESASASADDEPLAAKPVYQRKKAPPAPKPQTYQPSWGFMLSLGAIIMAFITLLIGTVYLKISTESDKDEIKAIETVTDAAMALVNAQVTHLKPQKSNWSHPDFLKSSLSTILPSLTKPLIDVDAQGKFNNCPYLLRIYTSSDLKNFLVIAQPAPSSWQWLLPRAAIMVDSAAMEIRKTTDLKNLNRQLVNINTLDELNPAEISQGVKEGKLVPLASLKMSKRVREFSPPKALAHIRPGAENLIYNAPRYHLFGEHLLDKAVNLMERAATTEEVVQFQQDVEQLKKFPDLILYSTNGIEGALAGEKALSTFSPKTRFLIGYLKINSHGNITGNNLLINEEISPKIAENESNSNPAAEAEPAPVPTQTDHIADAQEVDETLHSHPLYLQLTQLVNERKNVLKPLQTKMIELLKKDLDVYHANFIPQFQDLLNEYQTSSKEHQTEFHQKFFNLYHQYPSTPLKEFMHYSQKAGLEPLLEELLKNIKVETPLTEEQFAVLVENMKKATDFHELHHSIQELFPHLSLEKFPFPQKLIEYQQVFRSEAVAIIEKLLLSSDEKVKLQAPSKDIFTKILDQVWITAAAEREFYLNEFSLLSKQSENTENKEE